MGRIEYERDSVSEMPTFSKKDKVKVLGSEKISDRLELQIDIVNLLTSQYDNFGDLRDEIMLLIDIYSAKKQLETAEYFQSYMTSNSPFMKEIGYPYIKEIKDTIKSKTEMLVGEE